jgi:hypothetical protein
VSEERLKPEAPGTQPCFSGKLCRGWSLRASNLRVEQCAGVRRGEQEVVWPLVILPVS